MQHVPRRLHRLLHQMGLRRWSLVHVYWCQRWNGGSYCILQQITYPLLPTET